ncbi:hypothetical protein G3I40_44565 [Streptomyces sp. SID14478]|uniref:hypothetical protein n=1 Tax=Streptomyces sp. SID14478 TaxID=2706073 RepID=UPI0013E03517|nr:hypothetical protein [Streptomyces sp. SID14478]NEB82239.1 hypothetical protein [Streptomyces sp. SID14478]
MATKILRTPWRPGPAARRTAEPVHVSVTEFTADTHPRSLGVAVSGLRLRRTWPDTPGAVGMWLWVDPPRRRSGSVSVWTEEQALTDFVGRADHVRIVRAFRGHGTVRAAAWTAPRFDAAAVWDAVRPFLAGAAPGTASRPRTGKDMR